MTAKQIVNRLLEDYDPDLDPISPESVSNAAVAEVKFDFIDNTDIPWVRTALDELVGDVEVTTEFANTVNRDHVDSDGRLSSVTVVFDRDDSDSYHDTYYIYRDMEVAKEWVDDDALSDYNILLASGAVAVQS